MKALSDQASKLVLAAAGKNMSTESVTVKC
jgi:hypothetical protein